jgi:hypothetical protein
MTYNGCGKEENSAIKKFPPKNNRNRTQVILIGKHVLTHYSVNAPMKRIEFIMLMNTSRKK